MFKLFWLTAVLPLLIFARETYIYPPDGPAQYENCECTGRWVEVKLRDIVTDIPTILMMNHFLSHG